MLRIVKKVSKGEFSKYFYGKYRKKKAEEVQKANMIVMELNLNFGRT